jgi:hypothetical protein
MKKLFKLISVLTAAGFLFASCEGPMGPAGKDGANGANGADGQDANETCKECHNPEVVDAVAVQFELSKHNYGEAAFEEAGNVQCAPCHESTAFQYVCKNNTPATFTQGTDGKWANDYKSATTAAFGDISCFTCHSSLHKTYEGTDFSPLTNTAAVSMTMWKAEKTINLTQDGGMSNLCVKCHQPRPLTTNSKSPAGGDVVDYEDLAANPTDIYYDSSVGSGNANLIIPSYRTHVHYGTVGAVFAGTGGVPFTGSLAYENSPHTTAASCQDCHMATIFGASGGHTFNAAGNFNGCNVAGCHDAAPLSASSAKFKDTQAAVKTLLDELAAKINEVGAGTDILHTETDVEANLWAGHTTKNYDGYLDIYDASSNRTGYWRNPNPSSTWSAEEKADNLTKPVFPSLTKGVLGAMINFQFCLREYSLGIHNTAYTKALLTNSIESLTAGV